MTPLATLLKRLLDGLWYLGLFSLGIFVILLLWSFVGDPSAISATALEIGLGGVNVEASQGSRVTVLLPVALEQSPAQGELRNIRAEARFPVQKGTFFSLTLVLMLATFLAVVWIVAELRQVAASVGRGQPFARMNIGHLQRVGLGIILLEVGRAGAILYWSHAARGLFGADFVPAHRISIPGVFYGLIVLVIAEVFREGTRLQEEQSLTI